MQAWASAALDFGALTQFNRLSSLVFLKSCLQQGSSSAQIHMVVLQPPNECSDKSYGDAMSPILFLITIALVILSVVQMRQTRHMLKSQGTAAYTVGCELQ